MNVLTINTYGGSLILGAKAAGATVIGSLEDSGFGSDVQALNFPDLDLVTKLPWPDLDLEDVWVLAHPPCSAFSNQTPKHLTGEGTDAFACHTRVVNYALGAGCLGLALESVPGAIVALPTYKALAATYGYEVSIIFLNAVSFGVPQWRPRFWAIFRRKFGTGTLTTPKPTKFVGDIIQETGTELLVRASRPLDPKFLPLLSGEFGYGRVTKIFQRLNPDAPKAEPDLRVALGRTAGEFASRCPRVLDPDGVAPVLMSDANWYVAIDGQPRHLFLEEYHGIMGFPLKYQWPKVNIARMYLSKGVCPPVATWLLQTMVKGEMQPFNDLRVKKDVATRPRA